MLGLAVIPMVGVVMLNNTLAPEPDHSVRSQRSWATAAAAAALGDQQRLIETRLLGVVADPDLHRLVDGVSGADERQTATRLVAAIEGTDRGLVRGVCLTRAADGGRVYLSTGGTTRSVSTLCGSPALVVQAMSSQSGGVSRSTAWGADRAKHLLLSTELVGTSRRHAGVLTVEIGVRELFAATPEASDVGTSALLVDMTTSEILAAARTDAASSGSGSETAAPLGDLRVRVNGIVTGHAGTARGLATAGWASTSTLR